MSKNDLERKLLHGTGLVPRVDVNETLWSGRDLGERGIHGNAKTARRHGTLFCIPTAISGRKWRE
jgi:hypothetical protein